MKNSGKNDRRKGFSRREFIAKTTAVTTGFAFGSFPAASAFSSSGLSALGQTQFEADRYLFLDPSIIAELNGSNLTVNPAERRETVIIPDKPWENHMISFFLTVRDNGDKLRMWYVCRDDWGEGSEANVAYAESTDGVQWTKPNLGIYNYKGSTNNNLLGLHSLEGAVFQDPNMPDSERYIYLSTSRPQNNPEGPVGIYRNYSPDGFHWKRDSTPLIQAGSDTQNVVWWDERLQKYVLILRGWNPNPNRRKVMRIALPSLKEPIDIKPTGRGVRNYFYDEIPTVLVCDEKDPVRTDIYNMSAQPYELDPSWYVGFPTFLRRSAKTDAPDWRGRDMGPTEIQFVGSSDSINWNRYDRSVYAHPDIALSEKKNMVFMGTGLVFRGNEIWQYGTEYRTVHGDIEGRRKKTDGTIVRYVHRTDGFISVDTENEIGKMRTVPVKVTGDKLLLNMNTGALGEMRVGLIGENGKSIPGFELQKCSILEYNGTGVQVHWENNSDLSSLIGQEIALEFVSNRTKLYSFRFES